MEMVANPWHGGGISKWPVRLPFARHILRPLLPGLTPSKRR
jgi:hypothetical protein